MFTASQPVCRSDSGGGRCAALTVWWPVCRSDSGGGRCADWPGPVGGRAESSRPVPTVGQLPRHTAEMSPSDVFPTLDDGWCRRPVRGASPRPLGRGVRWHRSRRCAADVDWSPPPRPPSLPSLRLGPVGGRTTGAAVTAARARDSPVDRDGSRRRHVTEPRRICRGQCLRAGSPSAFAGSACCCSPHNSVRHGIRSSDILAGVMDLSLRFSGTPICP